MRRYALSCQCGMAGIFHGIDILALPVYAFQDEMPIYTDADWIS